jgi:tRNA-2-methylthio-N6-dimethylallyladenosine synthase
MSRYYLWSIGCQMNDADATTVRWGLGEMGFWPASEPREAELVVLITCVVRQRAEDNAEFSGARPPRVRWNDLLDDLFLCRLP